MRSLISLPVLTKDISKLGACPSFSCCPPISARQHRETAFLVRQSQQVQRIGRGGDLVLANLQVALGAGHRVMTQQRLNGSQIHPGFQ